MIPGENTVGAGVQRQDRAQRGPGLESPRDLGLFSLGREKQEKNRVGEGQTAKDLLGNTTEDGICPGGKAGAAQDQRCFWDNEPGQHQEQNPGKGKGGWRESKVHSEESRQPWTASREAVLRLGTLLSNAQGRSKPVL